MASAAACIAPLRVASQSIRICQAVCHPLSGGSVACLVSASPHFTQATAPYARSLSCQRFAFQRNAVQCFAIRFHCAMRLSEQGKAKRANFAPSRAKRGCKARMRRNRETGYPTNSGSNASANTTFRAGSMVGSVVPTDSQALHTTRNSSPGISHFLRKHTIPHTTHSHPRLIRKHTTVGIYFGNGAV